MDREFLVGVRGMTPQFKMRWIAIGNFVLCVARASNLRGQGVIYKANFRRPNGWKMKKTSMDIENCRKHYGLNGSLKSRRIYYFLDLRSYQWRCGEEEREADSGSGPELCLQLLSRLTKLRIADIFTECGRVLMSQKVKMMQFFE